MNGSPPRSTRDGSSMQLDARSVADGSFCGARSRAPHPAGFVLRLSTWKHRRSAMCTSPTRGAPPVRLPAAGVLLSQAHLGTNPLLCDDPVTRFLSHDVLDV